MNPHHTILTWIRRNGAVWTVDINVYPTIAGIVTRHILFTIHILRTKRCVSGRMWNLVPPVNVHGIRTNLYGLCVCKIDEYVADIQSCMS